MLANATPTKMLQALRGDGAANERFIPNDGERYGGGKMIVTVGAEPIVNQVISKRMVKQ